jgi:spermidine synthase
MRFYELDPEVVRLSAGETPVFTFVREARGELSIVTGDGRLALAAEDPQGFDVLVLDAFSSDAIPTHLLTREAFSGFERHLAPGGALVVQVTNRYVDLKPVVRGVASSLGLRALHVPSFERGTLWSSDWVLVARDSPLLEDELVTAASLPAQGAGPDVVWTDDWSELAAVLKR